MRDGVGGHKANSLALRAANDGRKIEGEEEAGRQSLRDGYAVSNSTLR